MQRIHYPAKCVLTGIVLISSIALSPGRLVGQLSSTSTASVPKGPYQAFDVISVKPNISADAVTDVNADALFFRGKNIPIKLLISNAYHIREGKIHGLPKWAEKTNWDIDAKVSEPDPKISAIRPSPSEALEIYQSHLQAILRARFGLHVHIEERPAPIYTLTVATGGPKLKDTKTPESQQNIFGKLGEIDGKGITTKTLAEELSSSLDRDVADETGLHGKYDMELQWDTETTNGPDPLPALSTVLQDQLGLKLLPGRGKVKVLVVDRIELPSAN